MTHYALRTTHSYRKGQGLLETTVALSILITGAVALLVLVIASSVSRSLAETQTVAANLAREGVEITRNLRDTNWIQAVAFDTGLVGAGNDYTFGAQLDPATNTWVLFSNPTLITDATATVYRYTAGAHLGAYTQSATGAPASTATVQYNRLLTLDAICASGAIVTSGSTCAGAGSTKVGIRITSTVRWTERSRVHTISIEERIYDWR